MRKLRVYRIAVFACALALGMFIGSGWHASVHQVEDMIEDAEHAAEHHHDPAGTVEQIDHHDCPICQNGLTSPEFQSAPALIALPELPLQNLPAWAVIHITRPAAIGLPLTTGPPALG